jgi:hypothetical protein
VVRWAQLALICTLVVGCQGKVLNGECVPGDSSDWWECRSVDGGIVTGGAIVSEIPVCSSSYGPNSAANCGIYFSGPSDAAFLPPACVACGGGDRGTLWTCGAPGTQWSAAGEYTCSP